jgi:EAL domain-containing protein (putative c-di-GMP-specific phosphodiesterase class I)/GGDEF domain-containing protein
VSAAAGQGPGLDGDSPEGARDPLASLRLKGALYDPNTELHAYPAVQERIRGLFHKTRCVGVLHLEIDPHARVESVYGWQVFDGILSAVAQELRQIGTSLHADTVICQSGIYAERFLLFMPLSRAEQAGRGAVVADAGRALHERIARRLQGPEFGSMTPRPTFSIGAATILEHPFFRLERQILHGVDEARSIGLRGDAQERTRQHAELKRIIREQSIETLFQPIIELDTEKIIGYEALTRGPRDSMFEAPSSLFEYSREVGMSCELDIICQRAALKQARRLSPGDKLFLNALPTSLMDPGFREGLLADLPGDCPIGRENIVLEIAGRASLEDFGAFGSEISDLRARGFRMSIDDVGSGPSSLESLGEVHPDFIKVDGSVIKNIHREMIKQELLRSICQAADGMSAEVIAEGIETAEELETVRRCGAHYGQGYLFSRPSSELPARRPRAERGRM